MPKIDVVFPERSESWLGKEGHEFDYHHYYHIHISYILNMLRDAGLVVKLKSPDKFLTRHRSKFDFKLDGKRVCIDFADHPGNILNPDQRKKYDVIFKMHYDEDKHSDIPNMFPLSPVSFHNWKRYRIIKREVEYKAEGPIRNNQKPNGAALKRRHYVQDMLRKEYDKEVDCEITHKNQFLRKVDNALVFVCVPGARNNMLDRGHGQLMALGACVICPKIVTNLNWHKKLESGVHYVECDPNYDNLIEKIEWVRENPEEAIKIGKNAQRLFNQTCLPRKQVQWIRECIKEMDERNAKSSE